MLQGSEGQPLQMLERDLKGDTMEVEDDASSKTCEVSKEDSKENLAQGPGLEVNVEPSLTSIERPMLEVEDDTSSYANEELYCHMVCMCT